MSVRVSFNPKILLSAAGVIVLFGALCVNLYASPLGPGPRMFIVAHQDDDLLFPGSHLYDGLSNTWKTVTVFVTAGNVDNPGAAAVIASCSGQTACIEQRYIEWRMAGSLAAYWDMALRKGLVSSAQAPSGQPSTVAGATDIFQRSSCAIIAYGSAQKRAYRCSVGQAADLIYLGLSSSQGIQGNYPEDVGGYNKGDGKTLEQLWKNQTATLKITDDRIVAAGSASYSRADLIGVLRALILAYAPASIGTLDSTKTFYEVYYRDGNQPYHTGWSIDHSDHIYSALFALEAERASAGVHSLSIYRTYNLSLDERNLTCAEAAPRAQAMTAYGRWDWGATYEMTVGNACSTLFAGGDYEKWTARESYTSEAELFSNSQIQAFGGRCLEPGGTTSACTASSATWTYDSSGRLSAGTSCLDASAPSLSAPCLSPAADAQRWTFLRNGQLRGDSARCLTISGTSVVLAECTQLVDQPPSPMLIYGQRWTRRADVASSTGKFPDTGGWASADSYYRSIRLGDIDGDQAADLCARGPEGIWCARSDQAGNFGALTLWGNAKFHDASGWGSSQYGSTMQLGDIDGDGDADICGRGGAGVWCALSDRTGFGSMNLWTTDFSDAQGWANSESYYRSIRLADIDGDGDADLCGRGVHGILCAVSTRSSFAGATWWGLDLFNDGTGWLDAKYGTTIQFGDLDGDGRADVCGRGGAGILCSISDGAKFGAISRWTPDFSDAQGWAAGVYYYGAIRLGDVDGDGRADVCGRGAFGVMCGSSNGLRFERTWNEWVTDEYSDALGWSAPQQSTTFALGDLNGDGRADLCARHSSGVRCSLMP